MKKLNRLSYGSLILLGISFLMQHFHVPGGVVMFSLSLVYSLVFFIIKAGALRKEENYRENLIVHAATFVFHAYFMMRYMFLGFTKLLFPLMLLLLIFSLIVLFSKKYKHLSEWLVWGFFLLIAAGFTQLRSHEIYAWRFNDIIENTSSYNKVAAPEVLDRYAWYLNLAGMEDEAGEELDKALKLFDEIEMDDQHRSALGYLSEEQIREHKRLLEEGEWKNYP